MYLCWSRKKDSVTSLMIARDLHIQDWADLRGSRIHAFTRSVSSLRCKVYSRHDVFISSSPSSSSVMKTCPVSIFFEKQHWSRVWSISVCQEVLRISARIHATTYVVLPQLHPMSLWLILYTNLLLHRRHRANQFNGFITTEEVNGFHSFSFAFQFFSFRRRCWHEIQDVRFRQN